MSVVEVKIGERNFQLACEEGQEENLKNLAEKVDERFEALSKQMRTSNDTLLILLSALMAEDELEEYKSKFSDSTADVDYVKNKEEEMLEIINTVSDYVESLVEKVEGKKAA